MKFVKKIFILILLVSAFPVVSLAESMNVTLPDGTIKSIETRPIYSSSDPTDNLIDAVAAKDLNKVKEFLAQGAKLNAAAASGGTALSEALNPEKAEILDFLLSHGADVNVAVQSPLGEISPLQVAVNSGYIDSTRKLLDRGANLEKENSLNETVLFTAVRHANPSMVQLLLGYGADPDHKNIVGETPLSLAERSGSEKIVELFKQPPSR